MFNRNKNVKKVEVKEVNEYGSALGYSFPMYKETAAGENLRLIKENAELQARKEAVIENVELREERDELKTAVSDLRIEKSEIEEQHARRIRDIEHKVGLLKTATEQETKLAIREAKVEVAEDNIKQEREAFEERIKQAENNLANQVEFLTTYVDKALGLVPKVDMTAAVAPTKASKKSEKADSPF